MSAGKSQIARRRSLYLLQSKIIAIVSLLFFAALIVGLTAWLILVLTAPDQTPTSVSIPEKHGDNSTYPGRNW
jgi:hypothetical protein